MKTLFLSAVNFLIVICFTFAAHAEPNNSIQPPIYQLDSLMNSAMGTTMWKMLHKNDTINLSKECASMKWALENYVGVHSYCKIDSDCVRASELDYFACAMVLNKNSKAQVVRKIRAYSELCAPFQLMDCIATTVLPQCTKTGRCKL
jgi:hypothetical protein